MASRTDAFWVDDDDRHINVLGTKAIDEIGIAGVAAAIANAHLQCNRHPRNRHPREHLPSALDNVLPGLERSVDDVRTYAATFFLGAAAHGFFVGDVVRIQREHHHDACRLVNFEDAAPGSPIEPHRRGAASFKLSVFLFVLFRTPFEFDEKLAERWLKVAGFARKLLQFGGKVVMETKPVRRASALAWNTSSRVSWRWRSR